MTALALAAARQAAVALALAAAALAAGAPARRWLAPAGRAERIGWCLAAGLGLLATTVLALGTIGWLRPAALWSLLVAAMAVGVWMRWRPARSSSDDERIGWRVLGIGALALVPAFVLSLYPPNGFDELGYHLPSAAAFAKAGGLPMVPEHLFPVFPQLGEVLAAAVLALASDVATHAIQLVAMAAITAAVGGAALRYGGPRAAVLAVAVWLGNPLAHYEAASSYIDLVYALFALLAALAWERWRDGGGERWLVAAGAFAGLACDTKYLGLIWLLLLAAMTRAPAGPRARHLAVLAGGALATGAPWYLRILVLTRNPLFPFLSRWFPGGGSPWEALAGAGAGRAWITTPHALAANFLDPVAVLTLPWRAALDRDAFHHQAPLSAAFILLLPVQAVLATRDARLRRWLLLAVAYAAMWTAREPRFQLPVVALLSVAGGLVLTRLLQLPRLEQLRRRGAIAALALLLALPGPLYAMYRVFKLGPVPTDAASREAFLVRRFPPYAAVQWLRAHATRPYTLYGLGLEGMTYHVDGRCLCAVGGPFAQRRVWPLLARPEQLHALLSCWGAEYLLIARRDPVLEREVPTPSPPTSPAFAARFPQLLRGPGYDLYAVAPRPSTTAVATRAAPVPPMQCLPALSAQRGGG